MVRLIGVMGIALWMGAFAGLVATGLHYPDWVMPIPWAVLAGIVTFLWMCCSTFMMLSGKWPWN